MACIHGLYNVDYDNAMKISKAHNVKIIIRSSVVIWSYL